VLLVRDIADRLGSFGRRGQLLASTALVLGLDHSFCMGIGCVGNWFRNRSFHCAITGPMFLMAGIFFLLADLRIVQINARLVWSLVFIGTGIAFLLEWRYAKRSIC
jgi:hypothetical protein